MIKLFLGNRASALLLLPLIIAGFLLLNFSTAYFHIGPLINLGFWGEATMQPLVSVLLAGILILLNAVFLNYIYNTNEFLERNSYGASVLYVVLMSFYHSFYSIDGLLIAHVFVLLMLNQFFMLRQNEDGRRHVFNGAFFAGIAATFHPPLLGLLPFIFVMIWTIRPFVFREILLAIMGFSTPLIYAAVFLWYSGHAIEWKLLEQVTNFSKKQVDFLVTSVMFTLWFLLSLVSIRSRMQKSSIRLKKLVSILWILLLVGLISGILDYLLFRQIEKFSLMMLPLSFFLTFSFTNKTFGFLATILFYLTLVYSLVKFFF